MSKLFLHPVKSGERIASLYKKAFSEAVELHVLSAYLRTWNTKLKLNGQCDVFSFVVGKDFGITRKQACRDVLKWLPPRWKPFFFVTEDISGFHPKALFWRTKDGACYFLIGSSNLSEAGWETNYEANAFGKLKVREYNNVIMWIDKIRKHSVPMSKTWLDAYQEAPPSRKRLGARGAFSHPLSAIVLPKIRDHAAIIRERRRKKERFSEICSKLKLAIRGCASGKITNKKFFKSLEETWGSHPSRISGWGWQVTGRNSDFAALCRGLVSIFDADARNRDFVVVKVIDDLKKNGVPTRRALLSELLCLNYPAHYPVLNNPIASYVRSYVKAPHGLSEGGKYLHLALCLRSSLRNSPRYPAKDLLELDSLIWEFQRRQPT